MQAHCLSWLSHCAGSDFQHVCLPGLLMLHLVDLLSMPSTQLPDFHLQVVHAPSRMFTGVISTLQSTKTHSQPQYCSSTGYPLKDWNACSSQTACTHAISAKYIHQQGLGCAGRYTNQECMQAILSNWQADKGGAHILFRGQLS